MKNFSIAIILLSISNAALAVPSIKAEVNGMVCAFCAKGIEKKLKALPEGKEVFVNLKDRIVVLELKEGKTVSDETFINIITGAGYSVKKLERVNETAEELRDKSEKGGEK